MSPRRVAVRVGAVLIALPLVLSTCEESAEPPVPTTIDVAPSAAITLTAIGGSQQLTAVVKDQKGNPLTGASVAWTTDKAAVATVSSTGLATAVANGTAQLGVTSGSASANVAVTVVQTASQVFKVSGDFQTDTVAQTLSQALVVQARDATGHPVAGATVTFAAASGSGSVGTGSVTADGTGQAQTTWTLGQTAGNQTATAAVGASPAQTFTATATAGPPATVAKQAGDGQTGISGQTVPVRPAVLVKDAFNNVKPGATVTFAAGVGHGVVTGASQTTNTLGVATVGSWTLGAAGEDTLTATVTGTGVSGNPAIFTATSQSAIVAAYVGNNQVGLVGYPVNTRPAVRVTDGGSNPVPGTAVTFAVTGGGGSLTLGTTTTNSNGVAQVGSWTLGAAAATNTITATVTGSGISGNPVTFADTGVAAQYNIDVQYYGPPPSPAAQTAMDAAVAKWESIVYRHVGPPVTVIDGGNDCGAGEPPFTQGVNDLLILARFDEIDGPGQILGQAGPCYIRNGSSLTVVGMMVFDSADIGTLVSNGQLNSVILHEMGHVLGFGTLWSVSPIACLALASTPPGTIQDTYFSCPKARAAFDSLGGTTYTGGGSSPPRGNKVPVENCGTSPYVSPNCGGGTVNGHWREVVLVNELMTGYLNAGSNPLSVASIAALGDIGYTVNHAAGDTYTHIFTAPPTGGAPPLPLENDVRRGPIYVVTPAGTVVRVISDR